MNPEHLTALIHSAGKAQEFRRYLGCTPRVYFNRYPYSPELAICTLSTFGIPIPVEIQEAYAQSLA